MQIGFVGLLTIIFVLCKLFGVVAWSWWVVFLPVLIPFGLFAGVMLVLGIGWVISAVAVGCLSK